MSISPPAKITVPFATSGLKNPIPANTDNVTGRAGYDAGFGAINMTPKTAGGIPPFGQDFNGIFFEVTAAIQYLEAGGSFPFDATFATAVGGYPIGALVSRSDNSGLWRNIVANNTTDPEAFGAGWQPEEAGSSAVSITNANVTLTALQAARGIIVISGALTANLNLIFPQYVKQWLVVNNCTGAFFVTAKTSAGSGVAIGAGSSQQVYGDGTNINAYQQVKTISLAVLTSPSGTFVVPAGIFSIDVEGWSGGGGGGGTGTASQTSGGGGGGGYSRSVISVTPGQSFSYLIGAGGSALSGTAGGSGGVTSFGSIFSITGGGGGQPNPTGSGGAGGVASGGQINFNGAGGGAGVGTLTGGSGGSSPFGGGGGLGGITVPGATGGPGAGGGGRGGGSTGAGGVGAQGQINIRY